MEINYLKVVLKLLVTSFVAHINVSYSVSYHGPCVEICIVSWENVSLQPYEQASTKIVCGTET